MIFVLATCASTTVWSTNRQLVTADAVGIDRPSNNITKSIYKFTFGSSGFQMGPTPPADQFQIQNNYNFVDTLSWVKGAHSIRVGWRIHARQSGQAVPPDFQWTALLRERR